MLRGACLLALLIGEYLILAVRFDTATVASHAGWQSSLLQNSPRIVHLAIGVGGAMVFLLVCGLRLEIVPRRTLPWRRVGVPCLIAHLVAFLGFAWVTQEVFEEPALAAGRGPWGLLWGAAGLATFIFWVGAIWPFDRWPSSARLPSRALLLGLTLAGLGCLLGGMTAGFWSRFHHATFATVAQLLRWLFGDAVSQPDAFILGTQRFQVRIAPECSGYEGIGLIWVFLAAYLVLARSRLRFPHALLVIPVGSILIWACNVLRLVLLVAIGSWGWRDIALGGFHSQVGWIAFNAVGLGIVLACQRWTWLQTGERGLVTSPTSTPDLTTAYLGPLLALVAATMITATMRPSGGGFDPFYPVRVLAVLLVLWTGRHAYAELRWAWSWPAATLGVAVYVVWVALEPGSSVPIGGSGSSLPDELARLPRAIAWGWLFVRVFGSVVTVPLAEELAFRGYLTRRLVRADFEAVPPGQWSWPSFLISSLLFGLMHEHRWLAGTLAGMAYAWAYHRRGRLTDAVLAHATTNALIAADAIVAGGWHHWS